MENYNTGKLRTNMPDNGNLFSSHSERVMQIIAALMDENLSAELRVRMQQWFRNNTADPDLEEAFRAYANTLRPSNIPLSGDSLVRYNKLAERLGIPKQPAKLIKPRRKLSVLSRIVAVIVPAAILVTWLFFSSSENDGWIDQIVVTTTEDSVRTLDLPDGSQIILNENSRLSYPQNYPATRAVSLVGTARFNVAKLDGIPFNVTGNDLTVTVLGTEFFMVAEAVNPITEVSLFTGLVSIAGKGFGEINITPGQHFSYDSSLDIYNILEMTEGQMMRLSDKEIIIEGSPLRDVIELLAGYFGVETEIIAGIDLNAPVRIRLDKDVTVEEAFNVMRFATGLFDYWIDGNSIIIQPPK